MIEKNKEKILLLLRSTKREGIEDLIKYLEDSTYFTDPASGYYHNNFPGGLADHSLKVYEIFKTLCKVHKSTLGEDSIIIISLLHDLCKVGSYSVESKWMKDENNKWKSYYDYGFKDQDFIMPHGSMSVFIASKYIKLTDVEAMAIAYHMGAYEGPQCYNELGKAYYKSFEVMLMHHADMQSAYIYEKVYGKGEIPFYDNIKVGD